MDSGAGNEGAKIQRESVLIHVLQQEVKKREWMVTLWRWDLGLGHPGVIKIITVFRLLTRKEYCISINIFLLEKEVLMENVSIRNH